MKIKAKTISLIAQGLAVIWVAAWCAYKFITNNINMTVQDIVLSGVAIAALFSPVYFSIIMDKIKDIKLGGKGNEPN